MQPKEIRVAHELPRSTLHKAAKLRRLVDRPAGISG
jgi:hypothetical protein